MPSFGCGVSVMTMNQTGASSMNTIAATKACAEFGEERASLTANLDRSRSGGNEYHFPDGCGNSGAALGNWFLEQFEEYAKGYKAAHGRRPPVSTALGVTTVVTPDEEAVAQWGKALRDKFVRDAVEVLGLWYGRPLDGWAKHVDEGAIEERGLTRSDELGDEGLHIHGAGRLEDTLLDEETLVKYLGAKGAKNHRDRYRGKNDGCMYRTGTILNKGKLHLLHQMFAVEMAERGWREPLDENDSEATGWSVKPHVTGAEKREREKQGEVFPEAGRSANKYARQARWERKQKAAQEEAEDARDAALAEEANSKARREHLKNDEREARKAYNEVQRELSDALDDLERARSDLEAVQIQQEFAELKLREANQMRWGSECRAERAEAYVDLVTNGYRPPAGVTFTPLEALPPEIRRLRGYMDGDYDEEELPEEFLYEGELDTDAVGDRLAPLEEDYAREHGAGVGYSTDRGIYLVDLPEDFVSEDGETPDEMDDGTYRNECAEYTNEVVSKLVQFAENAGIDPLRPQTPLHEREKAVEVRERELDERSERIGRELESANARLDGAKREAEGIRSGAESDAADILAAAKRDAEGIRAGARAKAYAEAKEEAGGHVDRYLRRVVGAASMIASMVLRYMRRELDLGERFDRAAEVCIGTLQELSEQDVRDARWGGDPRNSYTNRIQRGVSRFFRDELGSRLDDAARGDGPAEAAPAGPAPARERGGGYGDSGGAQRR